MKAVNLQWLRIPFVAIQIISEFTELTASTFPERYTKWSDLVESIPVVNMRWGKWVRISGCLDLSFLQSLLITTLVPFGLYILLAISYRIQKGHEDGRGPFQRHMYVGILLSFLVYAPVSSALFAAFPCEELDYGTEMKSYLRADYSIECNGAEHRLIMTYSVIMIFLQVVMTPVTYLALLVMAREKIAEKQEEAHQKHLQHEKERAREKRQSFATRSSGEINRSINPLFTPQSRADCEGDASFEEASCCVSTVTSCREEHEDAGTDVDGSIESVEEPPVTLPELVPPPEGEVNPSGSGKTLTFSVASDDSSRRNDASHPLAAGDLASEEGTVLLAGSPMITPAVTPGFAGAVSQRSIWRTAQAGQDKTMHILSKALPDELHKEMLADATRFLWSYYRKDSWWFEVFECFRRLMLTGALVFIAPGGPTQQYAACLFAVVALAFYAWCKPHEDLGKTLQYVASSIVIFMVYYLALGDAVDTSGEELRSQVVFAGVVVALSALMVISAALIVLLQIMEQFRGEKAVDKGVAEANLWSRD
ncbi:unnamed protein product [Chrysoparadoxa australica]